MSKLSEEDKLAFERAMSDVIKLDNTKKVAVTPKKPRFKKPKRSVHSAEPASFDSIDFAISQPVTAYESLLFTRPGSRTQDLMRLKKGDIRIERRLDLHGHTEQSAQQKLLNFIQQAHKNGQRYLLIIHGKGYNSDTEFPVIKNLVNQVLTQLNPVVGFCSAQPKDGGTGAVYVWLKSKSS